MARYDMATRVYEGHNLIRPQGREVWLVTHIKLVGLESRNILLTNGEFGMPLSQIPNFTTTLENSGFMIDSKNYLQIGGNVEESDLTLISYVLLEI